MNVKKILNELQLRKHIAGEVRKILREDAEADKIDDNMYPLALSAVDLEKAKRLVTGGEKDGSKEDDLVSVEKNADIGSCGSLKPSQTSMNLSKAWQFALSMINGTMPGSGGPGGNINAFVSSDGYIMDGHHRWIATFMVDPSASLKGHKVNLPGPKLVAVLNAITKGLHGIKSGKPGTGGFDQFKDAAAMKEELELQLAGKAKNQGPIKGSPEDVKKKLKDWSGADDDNLVDAVVSKVMESLSSLPKGIMPGAPDRKDMPVIDDDQTSGATDTTIAALSGGKIDLNPPYAKGGESKKDDESDENKKVQKSGYHRTGDVVLERWQRLAGLIK